MQPKFISVYIAFGTALRYLEDASEGFNVHGKSYILDNINAFFSYLEAFGLSITERASVELKKFANEIKGTDSKRKLTQTEASELCQIMHDIRKTLFAEAEGKATYIVTEKRIDITKLLANMSATMAKGVFEALPDISKYDFMEAGKCIAFERATAAAFHMMRGTEGVLRHYYCSIIKRGRVAKLMWHDMVQHLRKRRDAPPKALLDNLDNIRINFRNPTQHPEARYDMDEAQDLLSVSVDAINRIYKDLLKRRR